MAAPGAGQRRWLALVTVCVVLFLTMLDSTIVAVTLPSLRSGLHVGVSGLEWMVSSYLVVFAAFLLTGGTFGDRFGRRRLLVVGIAMFAVGSLVTAVASSIAVVYAGRVVQGLGAAASEPGTLSVLRQLYPDSAERARAIGIWAGVSGLALALGPVFGGVLVTAGTWRAVFWFSFALAVAVLLPALRWVPESRDPVGRRIDVVGQCSVAVALGALVFGLIEGQDSGYGSVLVSSLFAVAAAGGVAFVLAERRAADPMLPLELFRRAPFGGANIVAFGLNFGVFAVFVFVSLLLQLVSHVSGAGTAARFLPMTAAMILAAPLTGRWTARVGPRLPMTLGLVVAGVGMLLTDVVLSPRVSVAALDGALPVLGCGLGMVLAPMTAVVMSSVPRERSGLAAATTNVSRQLGAVVGVAVLGAIVDGRLIGSLVVRLRALGYGPAVQHMVVTAVTRGVVVVPPELAVRRHPAATLRRVVGIGTQELAHAMHAALLTAAVMLFVVAGVAALTQMRRHPDLHC